MHTLKLKVVVPSAMMGASFLQALMAWSDNHGLWLVVAAFCGVIIYMVEGVDRRMKAKLFFTSLVMGAACLLVGLQALSSNYTFEFESVCIFGAVIIAATVVIAMVKPTNSPAS